MTNDFRLTTRGDGRPIAEDRPMARDDMAITGTRQLRRQPGPSLGRETSRHGRWRWRWRAATPSSRSKPHGRRTWESGNDRPANAVGEGNRRARLDAPPPTRAQRTQPSGFPHRTPVLARNKERIVPGLRALELRHAGDICGSRSTAVFPLGPRAMPERFLLASGRAPRSR